MRLVYSILAVFISLHSSLKADVQKDLVVLTRSLKQLGSLLLISSPVSSQQEAQKRAQEEAQKRAQEEAQKRAQEEVYKKSELERRIKQEAEAREKKAAEEEAQRKESEERRAREAQERAEKEAAERAAEEAAKKSEKSKDELAESIKDLIALYDAKTISDTDFQKLKAQLVAYFTIVLTKPRFEDTSKTTWDSIGADKAITMFLQKRFDKTKYDEIIIQLSDWATEAFDDVLRLIQDGVQELKKPE